MEDSTLQVILEHCFPPNQIQAFLPSIPAGKNPYAIAAEEIFNESETGVQLSTKLDEDSQPQQLKIRSMKIPELRANLAVEFLEPGRTLGLILWSLLRDERLSARNLAEQLSQKFPKPSLDTPAETTVEMAEPEQEITLDQHIAELDEVHRSSTDTQEEDDLDLDAILDEIKENDTIEDEIIFEDELGEEGQEKEEPDEFDFLEDASIEGLETVEDVDTQASQQDGLDDETLDEVDAFISTLDEEDQSDAVEDLEDIEDQLEAESLLEDIQLEEPEESEFPQVHAGMTEEEIDTLLANNAGQSTESPATPVTTIQLGGISISQESLKRACESVFNEPVELVTDENLTQQDQIVVVGRQCGVRILHGPTWTQPIEPFRESTGEPVTINPLSLKLALSKIFGENIELIPDPALLSKGSILFAGQTTGLTIMENARATLPLPDWAEGKIPVNEDGSASVEEVIESLQTQLTDLQKRLETLEQAPPVVEQVQETVEEAVAEGHIAEEPIALDEIETEELEPVVATDTEEEPLDEEVLAAISEQESESPAAAEESEEGLDLGDVDLEEISLDDIAEETSEEDTAEMESTEDDTEEALADLGDLEELDVDAITEGEEESAPDEESAAGEDSEGDIGEELDLDALNLDAVDEATSDLDLDALVEEGSTEEEIDSSEMEDVDLGDILNELDSDESEPDSVEQVFHGEHILLLGGEEKNQEEYNRIVEEIGGTCTWHGNLSDMPEGEIAGLVEEADIVMTLSAEAVSDPGILQATNYAQEQNKKLVQHHSSNPVSIQKQLMQVGAES